MDTLFMNLEYSRTSDSHRLMLNMSNKIDLKSYMLHYQILVFTVCRKI